jgi:hypothetical protein
LVTYKKENIIKKARRRKPKKKNKFKNKKKGERKLKFYTSRKYLMKKIFKKST